MKNRLQVNGKSEMHALVTEGLVKEFGKRRVVDNVNIRVESGEVVGLLGPNGAGKTTTFYMIAGFVRPDEGRILLDGEDLSGLPIYRRARRGIHYLPQEPSVFRKLTVEENLLAILETLDLPRESMKAMAEELLGKLGISHLARSKAYMLSGGERRRVEIARALTTAPKFILLDEPFSGIDPIAVADIQNIIRELKEDGMGILVSDHNVRETLYVCDRAYIINVGHIIEEGEPAKIAQSETARKVYLGKRFTL